MWQKKSTFWQKNCLNAQTAIVMMVHAKDCWCPSIHFCAGLKMNSNIYYLSRLFLPSFRVSDVTIRVLQGVVAVGNIGHRRGALGLSADNA